MRTAILTACICSLIVLAGCVIPTPKKVGVRGESPESTLDLLKAGITTRDEVLLHLGLQNHANQKESAFVYDWATATIIEVLELLREEGAKRGSLRRFEQLQGFLTGELEGAGQSRIAGDLGMSAGAVRVAVQRLRKRFGRLLRNQIAQTVADPDQVDDEIRYLLSHLG